jgi:hypothetical protein
MSWGGRQLRRRRRARILANKLRHRPRRWTEIRSVKSGAWDDPTVWESRRMPSNGGHIVIGKGHVVTVRVI